MRYVNLSSILVMRHVSNKIKKTYPNTKSLMDCNLLKSHEAERLERVDQKTPHESSWVPLLWALKLIAKARDEEEMKDKKRVKIEAAPFASIQRAFDELETKHRTLLNYSDVNFPLAYTQVCSKFFVVTSLVPEIKSEFVF